MRVTLRVVDAMQRLYAEQRDREVEKLKLRRS